MERWVQLAKRADFNAIAREFHINPVIARLMVNRDVKDSESQRKYLFGELEDLYSPLSMRDIFKAADIVGDALKAKKSVAIASDFDVDGIFSSYILYLGFKRLGGHPKIYTPDRVKEGYGLNERIIREVEAEGTELVVTCDNGIAAFDAISLAKSLGLKVVITDHHDIPYEEDEQGVRHTLYTEADAVVNPKQSDCQYPFKKLCGAGVAFKLVQVLYQKFGIPDQELYQLVPYVAIATVADVMDLEDENRIFVKKGLSMMAAVNNPGLQALMKVCQIDPCSMSSYHIGFVIGPCFNAAGRLDTVKIALDLLMSVSETEAMKLAMELKLMNESRKEMTEIGAKKAIDYIETSDVLQDKIKLVLLEDCHESLVGIIAGRIKERYHCPAIVFTKVGEGMIKGSARSIEAYNIFEGLSKCKSLLTKFGGHPMAAGMSLREENFEALKIQLNEQTTLTDKDLIPVVKIDIPMPIGYISEGLCEELELLEPFGKGNTKPIFAEKYLKILSAKVRGRNRNVLSMKVMNDDRQVIDAVYFGDVEAFDDYVRSIYGDEQLKRMYAGQSNAVELAMLYYPNINSYNGYKNLQITVTGYCKIAR